MDIKTQQFDSIARNIFKPVYPVIAEQIVNRTGIQSGTCLDIGCGTGCLGAALAQCTELFLYFLDKSEEMIEIARKSVMENMLQDRSRLIHSDVLNIALSDNSINLAVSRGSIFFWDDLPRALREIYRVLLPGGMAYIGGGFGNRELKESIKEKMMNDKHADAQFPDHMRRNLSPETRNRFETALKNAGIDSYTILQNEDIGLWILIRK